MKPVVAVCGLRAEAKLIQSSEIVAVFGGGESALLSDRIEAVLQNGAAGIVSIGVAAGLQRGRMAGDCVIATEVVTTSERFAADAAWLQHILDKFPQAWSGVIAGTDKILPDIASKLALAISTKALAADMESHIVARAARLHDIPFAAIRVVSDDADHTLPPAALNAMTPGGGIDIMRVLGSLVRRPNQLGSLLKTASDTGKAMQTLLRCRDALGPRLACPYLG